MYTNHNHVTELFLILEGNSNFLLESTKLTTTFRIIIMQFEVLFLIFFKFWLKNIYIYKYLNYEVQNNYLLLIIKYQNAIFITSFIPLRPGIHSGGYSLKGSI